MATAGVLCACSPGSEIATVEVLNDAHCRTPQMGLQQIGYGDIASLRGQTLLGISTGKPVDEPELLLLSLYRGSQPTPGYRFELNSTERHGRTVQLRVDWLEPEPGAVLAQMMTTPCLVIGMERDEFDIIRAIDQHGALLGEVRLAGTSD